MGWKPDLPAPRLGAYTAAQVKLAASAWPMKCAEELRSAMIFRALRDAARRAGVVDVGARAARIAREELRHTRLCRDVGARLGASPPVHDLAPVQRRLGTLRDPRRRVAALVLVEVAIGETVSAALFAAGRRHAREPLTRAALDAILRDEVGHARFGWAAAATLWPTLDEPERALADEELRTGLAGLEREVAVPALRRLEAGEPFDPALAELGVLAPETRVDAFYGAIERSVVPRLNQLGADGDRAWSARYR